MSSKTEIVNLALTHLGVGKEIAALETENSEEARAARRVYDTARDTVLQDCPWPFATRIAALALVEEEPNTEWAFSYRYPSDCIYLRRVLSGLRNDTRQSREPYKIAGDSSGKLIYTDSQDAQIEYTAKSDNPQVYPSDFVMAFSYLLAFLMGPRLAGDRTKLIDRAFALYQQSVSVAKAAALNEQQDEKVPEAELIIGRE